MNLKKIVTAFFVMVSLMVSGCAGVEPSPTTTAKLNQTPDIWEMTLNCRDRQERNQLFEKLWENDPAFRDIVQLNTSGPADRELVAGVYCLLMADPEISWRRNAGDKLFCRQLTDFQPQRLHDPARIALYTTIRAECEAGSSKKPAAQSKIRIPQVQYIEKKAAPITAGPQPEKPAKLKLKQQPTENKNSQAFAVTVIRASNRGAGYAAGLENMTESFKTLQFTHYDLVHKETLDLTLNETGEVNLPGLNRLNLKLLEFGAGLIITEVKITGSGQVLLTTKVEAPYGGNILIASPQPGRDRILIRIDFVEKNRLHI